ncbi:MAG: amidohydrolase family protein [Deltaproteobacteria bacterium]|nr:amidohydrolase family protein [Deltaproteobacteria bacterium]
MIIDGHAHLFHPKVISNVKKRKNMVEILDLQTNGAKERTGVSSLENALKSNGVRGCLVLPTAGAKEVGRTNESFYRMVKGSKLLYTAGTLHPGYDANKEELIKFKSRDIKGIKFCSFSQKFALDDPATYQLFNLIRKFNKKENSGFFVILDTLYGADKFFGSNSKHNTTPGLLAKLIRNFPEINFIAAHMGGLAAPFSEICKNLTPMDNLFLDTSNAAHVLSEKEFVYLLKTHGPEHIIFGTDWPWFTHLPEINLQKSMLEKAGFSSMDMEFVFSKNMACLAGITLLTA